MSEELKRAEEVYLQAKNLLLVVEKQYLLKEQQLRNAQRAFSEASSAYIQLQNKEKDEV